MGHLRDKMKADLELRRYSPKTIDAYLRCGYQLAAYYRQSPAELSEAQVRQYLLHLSNERKVAPATQKMHVAALKFLYGITLQRPEVTLHLPYPRVPHALPDILSAGEVFRLLEAVESIMHRAILMATYGAGLRISEACSLRVGDIDKERGLLHIRDGKRGRDRFVMLSPRLLDLLRQYWRAVRPSGPELFPGKTPGGCISPEAVRDALKKAVVRCGLKKRVTPHVLRHTFATHLLESGVDIRTIQVLLGHGSIRSTAHYTRVSQSHVGRIASPLDRLGPAKEVPPR